MMGQPPNSAKRKSAPPSSGGKKMVQKSIMSFFKSPSSTAPTSSQQQPSSQLSSSSQPQPQPQPAQTPTIKAQLSSKTASASSSPAISSVKTKKKVIAEEPDLMDVETSAQSLESTQSLSREERKKRTRYVESDSDDYDQESEIATKRKSAAKKRKSIHFSEDDDSEDDFKPPESSNDDDDDEVSEAVPSSAAVSEDEDEDASEMSDADDSPARNKRKAKANGNNSSRKQPTTTPKSTVSSANTVLSTATSATKLSTTTSTLTTSTKFTPKLTPSTSTSKLQAFTSSSSVKRASTSFLSNEQKRQQKEKSFKEKNETRYRWLVDMRDENGNRPGEADYDERTLFIPKSAWNEFTAFEKQFWEIKSKHWDTVVFFKKGKFYELYEKDADIGHQLFDLRMTDRVNMRMAGVPEASFADWAGKFIAKGFKVAKVDQVESAIGKTLRERGEGTSGGDKEKVLRRELTAVLTQGTLIDSGLLTSDKNTYCMSIKEVLEEDSSSPSASAPTFGISFVDTSTAEFFVCSFQDDAERTRFETLVVQLKPVEICYEKAGLSQKTMRILKNNLPQTTYNCLAPEREFWDADRTRDELRIKKYFPEDENAEAGANGNLPPALGKLWNDTIAISSLGGLVWYLQSLKIDRDLLSLKNFHEYDPVRHSTSLILDGQTLINLEVLENNVDGGEAGTLYRLLMRCETPSGKRLFKRWLCHPLRNPDAINDRLNAVDDFNNLLGVQQQLSDAFRKLPDLERIISRIHSGNCSVKDFVRALGSFKLIRSILSDIQPYVAEISSQRLKTLIQHGFSEHLSEKLAYFDQAFDHDLASREDKISPYEGFDDEFDAASRALAETERELQEYLKEKKKELRCNDLSYKDMGKELYQLEVPKKIKFKAPNSWVTMSQTQAIIRYHTPEIKRLTARLAEEIEIKAEMTRTIKKRMCVKFDECFNDWAVVVKNIAEMDCLMSLAKCKTVLGDTVCRPEFVTSGPSVLELEEVRHPCVQHVASSSEFIPNDTSLGQGEQQQHPNMILLTGPNMGGKSTLLRQTCIAVIMAQLGCYVPAAKCRLTPFDRIFTRIGANDNILAGQSTFMVELAETSRILKEATPRSLVILDELGRGTSTFDGYAIAFSVLHYLTTHVHCLGLFSTHYRMLTTEFENNPLVGLMFMNYLEDPEKREITFLYKLTQGVSPKSFGMNVASMAGVPSGVIDRAESVASKFEHDTRIHEAQVAQVHRVGLMQLADLKFLVDALSGVNGGGENKMATDFRAIVKSVQG